MSLIVMAAMTQASEKPNLVVIVADDLGWSDVSYHGGDIPTPHLDLLAKKGIQLDTFYVAPMCTPTRVGFLTGRYWSRFGNTNPSNTQVIPFGTTTLASHLKDHGYRTSIFGKWHLGSKLEWGPAKFGFDESYGSLAGGVGPWLHKYKKGIYSQTWHRNGKFIHESGHVTDLITTNVLDELDSLKDSDPPSFIYIPFTAVHNPIQEPDKWRQRGESLGNDRPDYSACVMHMDHSIGRIAEKLELVSEYQKRESIILFFSDNGGTINPTEGDDSRYPGVYGHDVLLGRNTPLRGRKTQLYEGGIRVPAILYCSNKFKPKTIHTPLHVVDLFPSLCSILGVPPASGDSQDGADRSDLFNAGNSITDMDHQPFYWLGVSRNSRAVMDWPWKWIQIKGKSGGEFLFNLAQDPNESINLVSQNVDIRNRLFQVAQKQSLLDDKLKP